MRLPPPTLCPAATRGLAVLAPPVATVAQLLLRPYVLSVPPILYFVAVALASWPGGLGPGFVAVASSA